MDTRDKRYVQQMFLLLVAAAHLQDVAAILRKSGGNNGITFTPTVSAQRGLSDNRLPHTR
jgi:hypothetical protein